MLDLMVSHDSHLPVDLRPPDDKYARQTSFADPLYAVWGRA
ncbi:hypothetical protein MASR1M60_06960 [Rhodocyclaceae bacterium]